MTQVTVIIAARNAEDTLGQALQSLSEQTFRAWRAIVVDDGSSDGTAGIAHEWAARNERIDVITLEPSGASAARNRGVEAADSRWIVFLDSDDLLHPEHLSAMLEHAEANAGARLIHCQGHHMVDGRLGDLFVPPKRAYFALLSRRNIFFIHGVLVEREAIVEVGGFDENLEAAEEWDLWQRLARAGHKFAALDRPLAFYRLRPGSLCSRLQANLECSCTVVRRGHAPDPRVPKPLARFASGMPKERLPGALFNSWLWVAGNALGLGSDPLALLPPPAVPDNLEPVQLAQTLVMAMARGACVLDTELWRLSLERTAQASGLLDFLEAEANQPGFAAHCLDEVLALAGRPPTAPGSSAPGPHCLPSDDERAVGKVAFGDLARREPFSRVWGYDRGTPIDRLYIESFLEANRDHVRGRVLEVGDDTYTRRFGGERVTRSDVLNVKAGMPGTTIVGDIASLHDVADETFDCIICTQVLLFVFDLPAAMAQLHRLLGPGGTLLLSLPGISRFREETWGGTPYWFFTTRSVRDLLEQQFEPDRIAVHSRGNLFTAIAFLAGLSQEDIASYETGADDPEYQVTVLARARKPACDPEMRLPAITAAQRQRGSEFLGSIGKRFAGPVMLVAAHPDDDIIGAGLSLRDWPEARVVFVTNGCPFDVAHAREAGFDTRADYAAARHNEALAALEMAGLKQDRVTFLDFDDQRATIYLRAIALRIARLVRRFKPEVVVTHAYEGGHPDHDATCFGVHAACRLLIERETLRPALVEMSAYFGDGEKRIIEGFLGPQADVVVRKLGRQDTAFKRQLMSCHASQANVAKLFRLKAEVFRPALDYDFLQPPHAGKLFYEYHPLGMTGPAWRRHAAAALKKLRGP